MVGARGARDTHESALLAVPNVVGVGTGQDERTGEEVLLVLVTRKVPVTQLRAADVIPKILDGVPVHVRVVGEVAAQEP